MPDTPKPGLRPPGRPPLEAILFDLGDTLMHIHPDVPTMYAASLRTLGLPADLERVRLAIGGAESIYFEALRTGRAFESSAAAARAFWAEYNGAVLAGLGAPSEGRDALAAQLAEGFWSPGSWRVFPEVTGVLDALGRAGLRMAVVSNFTDALLTLCETHELDGHFEHLVASATVGSQKPDVGIFRETLRRLGVDPSATLHVGDNYIADVLGARAAGIDAVLIDRTRRGTPGMFDFTTRAGIGDTRTVRLDCPVISDLRELLSLL